MFCLCFVLLANPTIAEKAGSSQQQGWVSLFDGKSLAGWKASERQGTFSVKDGMIVVEGKRSHLFYAGEVENADFKDFEFKAEVMTMPGANSGIYFHAEYQQTGWPAKGYESQVNNTHSDSQKTGGLYDTVKVNPSPAQDKQWFTQHIIVRGKHVIVNVNGNTVVDYIEPEDVNFPGWPGRKLSNGTFALQGHDPGSIVYYKNIMVKPLKPERIKVAVVTGGHDFEQKPFLEMFNSFEGVGYMHVALKDDSEIFEDIGDWPYDVIVLYNMTQKISPKRRKNFVSLLNKGVGLVALHHSIASFQQWPEYRKIIGARYFLSDVVEGDTTYKRSKFKNDVTFTINVDNKKHPITRALDDFTAHDETYKGYLVDPDNLLLLSTNEPSNNKSICWTRKYGNSKVVYIQLGHGSQAYNNENYRTLVANAIKWSDGRFD